MFCLVDDLYIFLVTRLLRKSGTPPKLLDSETIVTEITGEVARFTVTKISGSILNSTGHLYFLSCLIVANLYVRPKIYDFVNSFLIS